MSPWSSTLLKRSTRALAFALLLCVLLQPVAPIVQAAAPAPACGFAAIRGIVTAGDSGQPLPGVSVYGDGQSSYTSVQTDATGSYTLTLPYYRDPGPYEVSFSPAFSSLPSAAYLPAPVTSTQVISGGTIILDATLTRGGAIQGLIKAADTDAPLDGVYVTLDRKVGDEFQVDASGVTEADGRYVVYGLAAGDYALRYDSVNIYSTDETENYETGYFGRVNYASESTPIPVTEGLTSTVDFTIQRGAYIVGEIRRSDNNEIVPAVNIHAYLLDESGEGHGDFISTSNGSNFGTYAVGPLAPGKYLLFAQTQRTNNAGGSQYHNTWDLVMEWYKDVYLSSEAQVVELPEVSASQQISVDITLSPGATITGVVTDADSGARLANMGVSTQPNVFAQYGVNILFGYSSEIVTDNNGVYEIRGLPAGEHQVFVSPEFGSEYQTLGRFQDAVTVTVAGTATTTNVNLTARLGGKIEGKLTNDQAQSVADIKVTLLTEDLVSVSSTTSDSAGNYSFDNVAPGQYKLKFDRFDPCGCFNDEFYAGVGNEEDLVTVTPGATTTGINATMECNAPPPPQQNLSAKRKNQIRERSKRRRAEQHTAKRPRGSIFRDASPRSLMTTRITIQVAIDPCAAKIK